VFSAHVIVEDAALSDGRSAAILASLQTCLADHFDVEHSTFQLEPAGHVEHDSRHA
jgi:cobalt-zinc-cadmium efflux system protein